MLQRGGWELTRPHERAWGHPNAPNPPDSDGSWRSTVAQRTIPQTSTRKHINGLAGGEREARGAPHAHAVHAPRASNAPLAQQPWPLFGLVHVLRSEEARAAATIMHHAPDPVLAARPFPLFAPLPTPCNPLTCLRSPLLSARLPDRLSTRPSTHPPARQPAGVAALRLTCTGCFLHIPTESYCLPG